MRRRKKIVTQHVSAADDRERETNRVSKRERERGSILSRLIVKKKKNSVTSNDRGGDNEVF